MVADHALENRYDVVQTGKALHRLTEWLDRAINEGRAALESLRDSTTDSYDLLGSLQCAAEECAKKAAMELTVRPTGEDRDIHPIVRSEVYRIGYEAIQNACAHSHGSHLIIELEFGQDLTLRVRDDGHGIDLETLRTGTPRHFGLIGMRERAAQIGSTLTIRNSSNGGTEVVLLVPGKIVFARSNNGRRHFPSQLSTHGWKNPGYGRPDNTRHRQSGR
jgi:signal transduction histidine kinase